MLLPPMRSQTPWKACSNPGEAANSALFCSGKAVHVWLATTSSPLPCRDPLSLEESRKAASFASSCDRHRYRFSHTLLRLLLSAYAKGEDPAALQFGSNEYGKPFLLSKQQATPLRFNLSHSGEVVCCALAIGRDVGIDIESVDPAFDWYSVSRACFTAQEQQQLQAVRKREQSAEFFRIWTRKEAWLKAVGTGLGGLDQRDSLAGEFVIKNYCLHEFHYGNEYVGTVALDSSSPSLHFYRYAAV